MEALTNERRVEGYAWMTLTRAFDDTMVAMWKQGRGLGGAFSQRGHEAISVAAGMALGPDDVVAPMHRDLGTYLVRGMTPDRIFGNLLGRSTGPTRGRDANLHGIGDLDLGIIGFISHIPQALPTTLGVAMAFKMRRQPRVALTTVGDGGYTSGATHETLNMASLYQAPFVLIIEDNKYAYSTPLDQQMRSARFAEKVAAYDIPSVRVDGNDFGAVYDAVSVAVDRAREGGGPTVVEADTMRMLGHAIHDGAEYVPRELLESWERRDPVRAMRSRLADEGILTEDQLGAIDRTAHDKIQSAVAIAEAAPLPDPATLSDGVYA
ncbi:MAG TPA: thiamine pyrophosphate-dependent dehydrogenase E1 component subunit alpha [Acidimicrobiia bacterium]|nr:thiamine pyrophosphate-dependent dehydrogenase E1 component subunit alpha [Acidimicrobiia bacterium]